LNVQIHESCLRTGNKADKKNGHKKWN
jgi:hypothetical protein